MVGGCICVKLRPREDMLRLAMELPCVGTFNDCQSRHSRLETSLVVLPELDH